MGIVTVPPQFRRAVLVPAVAACAFAAAVAQVHAGPAGVPLDDVETGKWIVIRTVNRVDKAITHFGQMQGYRATIRSARPDGGEIIRYAWQRPGRIRMEFEQPHKGARLIYDPDRGRVYLWPFGGGLLPPMSLAPDNPLIQSPTGQRVDRSDVGALLDNIRALLKNGRSETLGAEPVAGRPATHVAITGKSDFSLGKVHRYDVWFDDDIDFPLKVVSRDAEDREIETVLMEDVVIDPDFPPRYFTP